MQSFKKLVFIDITKIVSCKAMQNKTVTRKSQHFVKNIHLLNFDFFNFCFIANAVQSGFVKELHSAQSLVPVEKRIV